MNWKNPNKEFSCVMVFIMRPSSTFQFTFGFNEFLWAIFSLDYQIWENFWFCIWVMLVWILILRHKWLRVTSYAMSMDKNLECKDHQIYSKMSVKNYLQKGTLISILSESYKKFIFWSTFSVYIVQTFLKIIWWQFLPPRSERLLILH